MSARGPANVYEHSADRLDVVASMWIVGSDPRQPKNGSCVLASSLSRHIQET